MTFLDLPGRSNCLNLDRKKLCYDFLIYVWPTCLELKADTTLSFILFFSLSFFLKELKETTLMFESRVISIWTFPLRELLLNIDSFQKKSATRLLNYVIDSCRFKSILSFGIFKVCFEISFFLNSLKERI